MEEDDLHRGTSTSEEESSVEEDTIPIELPQFLKEWLEHDNAMIKNHNKLHKLPYHMNVATILEQYWQYYTGKQLAMMYERPTNRYRHPSSNHTKIKPDQIYRKYV